MGLASEMQDERDLSYLHQNGINKIYTSKIFLTKNTPNSEKYYIGTLLLGTVNTKLQFIHVNWKSLV